MEQRKPAIRGNHVTLRPLEQETAVAIVQGERDGRAWAQDFPSEGDLMIAKMTAEAPDGADATGTDLVAEPWRTRWLVEYQGEVVGGVGCKGAPREGAVEIGYGIVASVQGRGVGTDAVSTFIGALTAAGVSMVRAETLIDNHASRRVLEKVGFAVTGHRTDTEGEFVVWRRTLQPTL